MLTVRDEQIGHQDKPLFWSPGAKDMSVKGCSVVEVVMELVSIEINVLCVACQQGASPHSAERERPSVYIRAGQRLIHSKPSQLSGQLPSNQHLTKTASCQPASQLVSLQCVAAWLPWAPASCQPVASQFEDPSICASQLPASSRA